MQYRRLGKSGLKVSALSFGSWITFSNQVDTKEGQRLMEVAYERGVNFFDNAEVYAAGQAEIMMGEALRNLGWARDTYAVSSKVFWGGDKPTQRGLSRKHVHDACHAALKRLQVDYLDLYFAHRPDPETPMEETVRAMDTLIQQGKVLYWGTSEWNAQQITQAHQVARELGLTPPTMEQPEYNLLHRHKVETDFAPLYESYGLGLTTWSPLKSGILTGKYKDGIPKGSRAECSPMIKRMLESEEGQQQVAQADKLTRVANDLDVSLAQLSLAWCLTNKNVSTVILGASKEAQLVENLTALDLVEKLTPVVLEEIDSILS